MFFFACCSICVFFWLIILYIFLICSLISSSCFRVMYDPWKSLSPTSTSLEAACSYCCEACWSAWIRDVGDTRVSGDCSNELLAAAFSSPSIGDWICASDAWAIKIGRAHV